MKQHLLDTRHTKNHSQLVLFFGALALSEADFQEKLLSQTSAQAGWWCIYRLYFPHLTKVQGGVLLRTGCVHTGLKWLTSSLYQALGMLAMQQCRVCLPRQDQGAGGEWPGIGQSSFSG